MGKNKDLQKMLTEFEKEFGHIKEWEIDRNERLRAQSKDAANENVKSGHIQKLGKKWGSINCKNPNFIKANKELIDKNGQHQFTQEDRLKAGKNSWKKRKNTNHINNMIQKSNEVCSKPILCFTKDEKFVKEYKSLSDASKDVGVSKTAIFYCVQGKQKTSAGFIWKYKK